MKFLNREEAPLSQELWPLIDQTMVALLVKRLRMRSVVDFEEGYDFTTDAVATGIVRTVSETNGVRVGVRAPTLMNEIRYDFSIPKTMIEAMKRDIDGIDDTALREAANVFASVENAMILDGIEAISSPGLLTSLTQQTLVASGAKELMVAAARSLGMFNNEFVDGPFKLLVSSATFAQLVVESEGGETMKQKIENILGVDAIVITDAVGDDKALVISQRGGDFVFYSGLDVQIGFDADSTDALDLFLIESGAFRVINPEAAIRIDLV